MSQIPADFKVKIGVQLHPQHISYENFAEAVSIVDEMGVDSIWNWDHFFPIYGRSQGNHFEAWTLLAAMAVLSQRAYIGCLVTCNAYRNSALLSNMAKTIDHISNGRLILGLGAGWFERDFQEYGYQFGSNGSRLAELEASLPILLHRWQVDMPKPIRGTIPILIGGGGEKKTLRIAAQYANIWHGYGDSEILLHKRQVLHQWCRKYGRDPQEIECSTTVRNPSEQRLEELVSVGITHIILAMKFPWDFATLERIIQWRNRFYNTST
jgi:probable F420-dependent oxidoreductase